jgi:hypothetical protein
MPKSRQVRRVQCQSPVHIESRNGFGKLGAISYAAISAGLAFLLAYWPASAGDILTKLNIVPQYVASVSAVPDRTREADRFSGISFEQRWSAVLALPSGVRSDNDQHKKPQAEGRTEKIPFSCELAFSRLITKGNFSTRCVARSDDPGTLTVG